MGNRGKRSEQKCKVIFGYIVMLRPVYLKYILCGVLQHDKKGGRKREGRGGERGEEEEKQEGVARLASQTQGNAGTSPPASIAFFQDGVRCLLVS